MTTAWFLLAFAADIVLAASFYPARTLGPRLRFAVVVVLGAAIGLTPLLLPSDQGPARLVLACVSACYALKLFDLHIGALRGRQVDGKSFLAFLGNLTQLVQRRTGGERQPSTRDNTADFLRSAAAASLAMLALRWTSRINWTGRPFLWQHAARATAFFVLLLFVFRLLSATIRMFGGYSVDPEDKPLLARTPADFWRRYNRWIGQFLQEDVFVPLAGRRHPGRVTMVVFALSGLGHEYVFWIAGGRAPGYQMAFFLLQGLAVIATARIKPRGPAAVASGIATLAFNILTSMLFFASVQGIWPIYPTGLPPWFPAW